MDVNGKKSTPDKVEKILEDHADVFADIINVLIYDGKRVVLPENLVDGPTASIYKAAEGNLGQKDRDTVKLDKRHGVVYAVYGLENQTAINFVMPVRCMGYDYASYEKCIRKIKAKNKSDGSEAPYTQEIWPEQKIYPVVTLVLYFGKEPWTGPKSLHEMMDLSEDLKKHVSDYKIDLCEVSFLEDEIIDKFQSDFRVVARYFVSKRLGNAEENMYNENKKWTHVGELMEFFRTFTNDRRFGEFKQFMLNEADKKGEVGMCELLDAFERKGLEKGLERGMARGLERGMERGEEKGRYESLQKLMEKTGMSELEAMNALDFSSKEKTGYRNWVNQ